MFWEAEDDAISYLLYRDGNSHRDNGQDITYEDEIILGTTYSYQIRVERSDGTTSDLSEATTFVATTPVSSDFDCVGNKGHIHWHDYHNSDIETWTITPDNQAGLSITVSLHTSLCLYCDSSV